MPDLDQLTNEVFFESIEDLLFHVGKGIATAQIEMDKNSLAVQTLLENDENLNKYGLQAAWYHFPETSIELKLSISLHWEKKTFERQTYWKPYLLVAPMNASYKNLFNYEGTETSVVKTRIVSIPPTPSIEME